MLKFIDLFAGLGGFHLALSKLGHECVFASEIDPVLQQLYFDNYGINPEGDIKKVDIHKMPAHDVLCGGFPCQPFSKAGKRLGRQHDNSLGNLFDEIIKILAYHKPEYFILENVPFIAKHDNEGMWQHMQSEFKRIKYSINHQIFSPHEFGIPQHRERIFIVGCRSGLRHFEFPKPIENQKTDIKSILDKFPENAKKVDIPELNCLKIWQNFIDSIPSNVAIPKFPIWGMEFGATYPMEDNFYPYIMTEKELGKFKGNFGVSLKGLTKEEQFKLLPSYARVDKPFPSWKKRYITQSRTFYQDYEKELKDAVLEISKLPSQSWQKLEWNVGNESRTIKDYIIQFRASGIRLKKTETSPSLVCTNTQIPIIGWEDRYITREEGARLQSIEGIKLPESHGACFKALGNAVNSEIIRQIAENLIRAEAAIVPLKLMSVKSKIKAI